MEIWGQGANPLTPTDKNFTSWEIEQKKAESAYFLHVQIKFFFEKGTKDWMVSQQERKKC